MPTGVFKAYSDSEYHYVFGEVYAPMQIDTDGESMTAEDIQKMAHDFIADGKVKFIDTGHNRQLSGAEVVESFIARKGDPDYREGAWVLGVRMKEGPLWDDVVAGKFNGYSVDAIVTKVPVVVEAPIVKSATGVTREVNEGSVYEPHTHQFYVEFGDDGRVTFGTTDSFKGHKHTISATVVTEAADGHTHRYFVE